MASSIVQPLISQSSFIESLNILINKPHVVNKRLWGSKTLFKNYCRPYTRSWGPPIRLKNISRVEECMTVLLQELQLREINKSEATEEDLDVVVLELLPKAYDESHAFQLIVLKRNDMSVTFYDITPNDLKQNLCPDFPYTLQLDSDKVMLKSCDQTSKSHQWLKDVVLVQFIKWCEECKNKVENRNVICNESLALVSMEKYYTKYNDLKLKYGKEMVKIWPECTDPSKFVYEDIAIATYLLLLWEDEREHQNLTKLQSFVDLGCGNGLLVYILIKEGHQGVGIDVRKRQIWDMYPNNVILEERTITPSDANLFPDTDWIIGNHSDELTPWIPVISARSSYKCNFFLLPCCAYNFDGTKYQRHNSSKSQYTEYLEYIQQLSEECGFRTDIDRLKIPSTKRICLVGRKRTYPDEEQDIYSKRIQSIINNSTNPKGNKDTWIDDFKARDPVEIVRNCTRVDKYLIEYIVTKITNHLLEGCKSESNWSLGKTVEIGEVVQLIPEEKLRALKSECGGLQTLMKNNHHIFKVQSGKVQLRYPRTVEEVTKDYKANKNKGNIILQQKPCWFFNYHPQGCPLQDRNCSFQHV